MAKRFSIFPLFFPKTIQRMMDRMYSKPLIYDENGRMIECCSSPLFHNIRGKKCVWCGKSLSDLTSQIDSRVAELVPHDLKPQPDFNSPTTATANPINRDLSDLPEFPEVTKTDLKPQSMDLVKVSSYCLKCKTQVPVLEPSYVDIESRRGIRRYLRGSCAVCGSKINAIAKRG